MTIGERGTSRRGEIVQTYESRTMGRVCAVRWINGDIGHVPERDAITLSPAESAASTKEG